MQATCVKCHRPIPPDQINVAANVARCGTCNEIFPLSDLVDGTSAGIAQVDLNRPPPGVWYVPRMNGFELIATTRSAAALFLVPFMLVWSGGSLGGIYGTQVYKGKFDLFQSLFGIPFLLGTLLFGSLAVMSAMGRIVLRIDGDQGTIFTGVGPIGSTKRFDFYGATAIDERHPTLQSNGQRQREIVIEGAKPVKFGSMLRDDRRRFVIAALRQAMKDRRRR